MITAQWATGRWGGKYRYYRCTKKNGRCSQKYLQEDALAMQTKEQLQSVSLPEMWAAYMLQRVEAWGKEDIHTSGTHVMQMKDDLRKLEA